MNLLLRWWFIAVFSTAISWSQQEAGEERMKVTASGVIREAQLYGIGYGKEYHAGVPCDGDHQLIDELGKVMLDLNEFNTFSMSGVRLKELVNLLNQRIPSTSLWKVRTNNEAGEIKVSGLIDKHLMKTLVDFMQKGQVHCRVTEGLVEFRISRNPLMHDVNRDVSKISGAVEPIVESINKPIHDSVRDSKNVVILSKSFGPQNHRDGMGYSGDAGLYSKVKEVRLIHVDHTAINQITLSELATRLNGAIPESHKWRFQVEDKIKHLRVSGALDEDLLKCLGHFMDSAAFHCRVTDGVVEFVSGNGGILMKGEVKELPAGLYRR